MNTRCILGNPSTGKTQQMPSREELNPRRCFTIESRSRSNSDLISLSVFVIGTGDVSGDLQNDDAGGDNISFLIWVDGDACTLLITRPEGVVSSSSESDSIIS